MGPYDRQYEPDPYWQHVQEEEARREYVQPPYHPPMSDMIPLTGIPDTSGYDPRPGLKMIFSGINHLLG